MLERDGARPSWLDQPFADREIPKPWPGKPKTGEILRFEPELY
jgi:hypothetical protein